MADKLRIVNLGISSFYEALCGQNCEAVQIDWRPPAILDKELLAQMEKVVAGPLADKIDAANEAAADMVIQADPVWIGIKPAGEVVEGLGDYTVTHSGPPISFENMVALHQNGMVSACLFEGWAKTRDEALKLIHSGRLRMISALDVNTVGAGTGIKRTANAFYELFCCSRIQTLLPQERGCMPKANSQGGKNIDRSVAGAAS